MRGLTSLKLSDLDSCRLIHISGSHFDVTATLIQRLMTQAIREHRMPVKALSKIHLIPPGRAKFPPSHLKSRGGWLHKIKLLASGLAWRAPGLCSLQTCPQL